MSRKCIECDQEIHHFGDVCGDGCKEKFLIKHPEWRDPKEEVRKKENEEKLMNWFKMLF